VFNGIIPFIFILQQGEKTFERHLVGQVSCKQHGILAVPEAAGEGEVAVA
jgi:hypothetical protein